MCQQGQSSLARVEDCLCNESRLGSALRDTELILNTTMQRLAAAGVGRPLVSPATLCRVPGASSHVRFVSDSPYGRAHVWKHRQRVLPKPFVPQFPQLVVRADGSTYTHITTSPRSMIRLSRDTTNNPLWNALTLRADLEEEGQMTGRMGRFNKRFEGLGGHGEDVDWMSGAGEGLGAGEKPLKDVGKKHKAPRKK